MEHCTILDSKEIVYAIVYDVPSSIDTKFRATLHRSDNLTECTRAWRNLWRRFRANSRDVSNVSVSFSLATNDRTSQKYIFWPCSLAFVPGRLRFSSWRNRRRSTKCHANSFPDLAPGRYLGDPEGRVDGAVRRIWKSPHAMGDEGEFPGQGTWNRYRLTNRGLRITDSMDPTESVSSTLA